MVDNDRGKLEILEERELVSIPRGDDQLRVTYTRANTPEGREVSWHSIRVWFRGQRDGKWLPGKQGITIRAKEMPDVLLALSKDAEGLSDTSSVDDDTAF